MQLNLEQGQCHRSRILEVISILRRPCFFLSSIMPSVLILSLEWLQVRKENSDYLSVFHVLAYEVRHSPASAALTKHVWWSISTFQSQMMTELNQCSLFQFSPGLVFVCADFDSAIGDPEVRHSTFLWITIWVWRDCHFIVMNVFHVLSQGHVWNPRHLCPPDPPPDVPGWGGNCVQSWRWLSLIDCDI